MIVGLIIGTIGGIALDIASYENRWSRRRLLWAWAALPLIVFIYPVIRFFFEGVRE